MFVNEMLRLFVKPISESDIASSKSMQSPPSKYETSISELIDMKEPFGIGIISNTHQSIPVLELHPEEFASSRLITVKPIIATSYEDRLTSIDADPEVFGANVIGSETATTQPLHVALDTEFTTNWKVSLAVPLLCTIPSISVNSSLITSYMESSNSKYQE